jgi:hypothetical protein
MRMIKLFKRFSSMKDTTMANNSSHFSTIQSEILISSVVLKFLAMITGIFGKYHSSVFTSKERTARDTGIILRCSDNQFVQ